MILASHGLIASQIASFDADASALAVGAGAATGLRPLFGLSSFSSTLNEGFF
jgi:hypothetical protein